MNQKVTTAINFFRKNQVPLNFKSKVTAGKKDSSPGFTLENYFLEMERRHTTSTTQDGRRGVSTAEPGSRKYYRENNPQLDYAAFPWVQAEVAKKELAPLKFVRGGRERETEYFCQQRPDSRYNKDSIYLSLDNKRVVEPRNWTRERKNRPFKGNAFRKTAGENFGKVKN